ncbi:hypothetical protein LJR034_001252 [Caballeronia sp. LjRoot34]|uniref:hypothetical protein n=1 Tax=Caballeronia sp. LjRoot34 TaxID=3342325 RepID=UPI003ED08DB7
MNLNPGVLNLFETLETRCPRFVALITCYYSTGKSPSPTADRMSVSVAGDLMDTRFCFINGWSATAAG